MSAALNHSPTTHPTSSSPAPTDTDQHPIDTTNLKIAVAAGSMFTAFALVAFGLVNPFFAGVGLGASLILSNEMDAKYSKEEKTALAFAKAQTELKKIGFIDPKAGIDTTNVIVHATYKEPICDDMKPLIDEIQKIADRVVLEYGLKESAIEYKACDLFLSFKS